MKKKSFLFVVNNFNIGGPQKSLLALLYSLDLKIIEVELVSLSNSGTLLPYLPPEVKIIKVSPLVNYALLSPENFKSETLKMLFFKNIRLAFNALSSVIKGQLNKKMVQEKQRYWLLVKDNLPKLEKKYDYAFGVSGGHSMMFIEDCVNAKKKIGWIRSDYRVLKRDLKIDRMYFEKMDLILSVSEMCKDIFLELFPETKNKVQVFYNMLPFKMYDNIPAETSKMLVNNDVLKLLTICRLDPHKGLDLALDALELLLKKGLKIKWFVLGEGSYRQELEKMIMKRGMSEYLILLGFQLNTAEFIKVADIIVHPSKFEGKSNVVDEAKYLLKPIVATRYNTVNEQISHSETGMIAEMSAESIVENIMKITDSSILKEKLIRNLKTQQVNDDLSVSKFERIIEDLD